MTTANRERILHSLRRLAGEAESAQPDGELLRRYLTQGDQSAFAVLVRRHGAMVFAVCRSVLRQSQDAEDACQAVFLILARKGGSIRQSDGLGGWLQRVAYRVALRARASSVRRQAHEAKAACSSLAASSCDDLSWGELRAVLHQELAGLPERFRAPLVLCYLEGLTQEEAARRLGWTAATVKGRVQRGREKLRRRLERRGVALTAALAAALTGQALAETAVRTPPHFNTATATAAELARGFLRPLVPLKLAVLSAVLLSAGLVAAGVGMLAPRPQNAGPETASPDKPIADRPTPRTAVDAHGDPLPDGAIARLGTVRFNHGGRLNALFFSPDGKTIISEGDGTICFWDANTGKELDRRRMTKGYFEVQPILLPDGKTLLALHEGFGTSDVIHWDLVEKKEIRTTKLPVRRTVSSTNHWDALSPDGKLCIVHVHTPAQVQVFDVTTGKNLYQLAKGTKEFLAVAFADNDRIVSADQKNRIEVWQARTGKLLRQFAHDAPIRFLLASPDGRWLASLEQRPSPFGRLVERDEVVHIWDLTTGTRKQSLHSKAKYWFSNVLFSPDGKSLLTASRRPGGSDEVALWDRATGRRLREFNGTSGISGDVAAISPDGRRLVEGSWAGKFELWDLENGRRLTSEDSRHTRFVAVRLSAAGDRATTVGHDSISYWDARTGRRLHSFELPEDSLYYRGPTSGDCGSSSGGRYAVTFRNDGQEFQALVWDVAARKRLRTLRAPGPHEQVTSAFSPDSALLAAWLPGKQTFIRIWDVRTGELLRSFPENKTGWAGQMSFTADGKTLFVAGKNVTAYEVASGKELFSWRLKPLPSNSGPGTSAVGGGPGREDDRIGWRMLAVSPDGTRVVAILWGNGHFNERQENRLALYDARSGKLLRRWNDSGMPPHSYEQLAFSRDGQLLASSDGAVVHLWEVATSKEVGAFKGHLGDVDSLAFSGDDRRLATASRDSTVLIWDTTGQATGRLDDEAVERRWEELLGDDAGRAHHAIWALTQTPERALPFLKVRLRPAKSVSRERIERLIQELDSNQFDVREKAVAELEKLGELAEAALRRTLEGKPTLEQRRRIEPLITKLETAIPTGEALRSLRAVRVLEYAATPEARRLLQELASGTEDARLTQQAKAALNRLVRDSR